MKALSLSMQRAMWNAHAADRVRQIDERELAAWKQAHYTHIPSAFRFARTTYKTYDALIARGLYRHPTTYRGARLTEAGTTWIAEQIAAAERDAPDALTQVRQRPRLLGRL